MWRRTEQNGEAMSTGGADSKDDRADKTGDGRKTIDEVGRTMPADFLAVGKDSIPYDLRVQAIERGGLPDILVDTAEAQPPGNYSEGSEIRTEIDKLLTRAARRLAHSQRKGE